MRNITIDGRTKNLSAWAKETGIAFSTMWNRVNKYGENAGEKLLLNKTEKREKNT